MTNTKLYYTVGEKVQGTYFGVTYSGTVEVERRHTINWNQQCYLLKLDSPITVLGATRDRLAMTVDLNTRQPTLPNSSMLLA